MCAAGVAASLAGCTKMDTAATTAEPAATEAAAKEEETTAEEKTETAAEPEIKLIGAHVNTVDSSYQAGFDAMKEWMNFMLHMNPGHLLQKVKMGSSRMKY